MGKGTACRNSKADTRKPEQDITNSETNSNKPEATVDKLKVDEPLKSNETERVIEDHTIYHPKVSIVFHSKSNKYEIISVLNKLINDKMYLADKTA